MKKLTYLVILLSMAVFSQEYKVTNVKVTDSSGVLDVSFKISKIKPIPVLSNFRVAAEHPNRVYYDSNVSVDPSNAIGFTISGKTIMLVNSEYFTVDTPFNWLSVSTIRYKGGSDFKGLKEFTLEYIKNQIPTAKGDENYIRFVNGNVFNSGNGVTEIQAFKTIKEALKSMPNGGGKIWIKAVKGGYDFETVYLKGIPTDPNNPNVIEGYKDTPGDITTNYFNYSKSKTLDDTEMPTFNGRGRDRDIFLQYSNRNYYIIKNIQVRNFKHGFKGTGLQGALIENCNFENIGTGSSKGLAISMSNTRDNPYMVTIRNCHSVNATSTSFLVYGDFSLIENSYSYCNEFDTNNYSGLTAHYYFTMRGSNNVIRNSHAEKDVNNGNNGHGFSLKANNVPTEYNLIENCESVNIYGAYETRHPETRYNVIKNSKSYTNENRKISTQASALVSILQGASYNIYENMTGNDLDVGIVFGDNVEEKANRGGDFNIIRNSKLNNIKTLIRSNNSSKGTAVREGNIINNVVFDKFTNFYINASSYPVIFKDNEFINVTFLNGNKIDLTGWSYD